MSTVTQERILAIDIGGTKYSMALFDGGHMVRRITEPTNREGGRTWMVGQIRRRACSWYEELPFARCGIGFGGPVDFERQRITLSTQVDSWQDYPLAGHLADELGLPVIMDNDANVGALGESVHGAGRGADPMFYMTVSTGIGGGLVVDGRIYRGADSYAGEIGHITVRPHGPRCLCGAEGCLERLCSGLWLERDHGRSAKQLLADPDFVRRYVVDLACGIKSIVMLLNPARIVIGGGIAQTGDPFFVPLRAELRRQITSWSQARVEVVPAALGGDSVLYGARELAVSACVVSTQ